jgi:hypothetical protein
MRKIANKGYKKAKKGEIRCCECEHSRSLWWTRWHECLAGSLPHTVAKGNTCELAKKRKVKYEPPISKEVVTKKNKKKTNSGESDILIKKLIKQLEHEGIETIYLEYKGKKYISKNGNIVIEKS